ncbi:peptidase [Candidatus Magnetobacterium bavaricum]|uniref:Peptidase n=1 Tax=Candidatus Magnetobacterium bavaricum TaxID=29290 RepID=A0A0F3GYC0_9BACT|nr:peptidase [Candidatus Magnetobacterium bavaricum]
MTNVEIFRTGIHTDSSDNIREWTEADLDFIAGSYDASTHEAPVVIGHPTDNAPAYGWIQKVWRNGRVLYADLKDVQPAFADLVKSGAYKKRSIALYPDRTLRHLGWLGAQPPAIKGLRDIQFSAGVGVTTIEFDTVDIDTNKKTDGGVKVPDKTQTTVEELLRQQLQQKEAELAKFSEQTAQTAANEAKLKEQLTAFSEQQKAMTEQMKAIEATNAALQAEKVTLETQKRQAEYNMFMEGLIREGRLTPAQKPATMSFMEIMHNAGKYVFAEGEKPAIDAFKAFLTGLPRQIEFGEIARQELDSNAGFTVSSGVQFDESKLSLHNKIQAYMQKHNIKDYKQAAMIVSAGGA